MQIFLVGGAVRDALLGIEPGDRDYVVVGATPEQMRALGYTQVGRDFPVFLHPTTHDEYALARTERKSGRGYTGFIVHAAPDVTLEDDLRRRDFTCNAIAQGEDGTLFDPFDGVRDIEQRTLRHVSDAFVEDPLRVIRAARFMAKLAPFGFTLADETAQLMRDMVACGELDTLVPERVWQELERALLSKKPSAFIRTLHDVGALKIILPEVDALYGVPQRAEYHPEIDTGIHTEMVCDMAAELAPADDLIGFAALTHDLGKAVTPESEWPRHLMHEKNGIKPIRALCERLKVPSEHRLLAEIVCREHLNVHRIDELRDSTLQELFERCDAYRKPARIPQLAIACEADKRGRGGMHDNPYPQAATLIQLFETARAVKASDLDVSGLSGIEIGEKLRKARIEAIHRARSD